MALETLAHRAMIDGFHVYLADWKIPDGQLIEINHKQNAITFKLQNGPVKENGINGCQVDTIIETAKLILEGLDDRFPCDYNKYAISHLNDALSALEKRRLDRVRRKVEGTNQE